MMNPNVIPTSSTVEDMQNFIPMQQGGIIPLQNLDRTLDSPDYLDTLNAMRYLQGQGISSLYPMQEGGMMEEAMMQEQQIPLEPLNPEEAMIMEQVEQDPRQPNPEAQAMARQVASYGRGGDKLILHVRPDELQGLASMLTITINPETGMPEAFFGGIRKFFSKITKPIRRVVKSKAFKTIAPIALAIAAPYALAYMAPAGTFAGATLGAQVASMSPLAFGAATGVGSLVGNLAAGRKFGDAAKAGLISGGTAGLFRGVSNKFAGKTFMGAPVEPASTAAETAAKGNYVEQVRANLAQQGKGMQTSFTPIVSSDAGTGNINLLQERAAEAGLGNLGQPEVGKLRDFGDLTQRTFTSPDVSQALQAASAPVTIPLDAAKTIDPSVVAMGSNQTAVANQPELFTVEGPTQTAIDVTGRSDALQPNIIVDAIKERYPLSWKGAATAAGDIIKGDIGASYLDMEEQNKAAEEAAENQLRNMGYSVVDTGFGGQRVIMDPSGVTLPASLTAAEILQRALGGGKKQYVARTTYEPTVTVASGGAIAGGLVAVDKEEGGLIGMARGGEFSGLVPGQGHGMEDNVYMPIVERQSGGINPVTGIADKGYGQQIGTLAVSPKEYVVDAHTMAALGNGNPTEGARVMDETVKQIRKKAYGTMRQPNEIDGLDSLVPLVQGV